MKRFQLVLAAVSIACALATWTAQAQEDDGSTAPVLPELIPAQNETGDTATGSAPAGEQPEPTPAPPAETQPPVASATLPVPPTAAALPPTPEPEPPKEQTIEIIEFQNAPVFAVLDYYARMTGRSIISAPNLAGTINFRSQTNLTKSEALQALDSVLAINGIGTVPMGKKFLKVVQIATAKQEGIEVGVLSSNKLAGARAAGPGHVLLPADTLMTQIIPLQYAEATEVVGAMQPYLHPYGQLMPLTKSNSILITETSANLNQMLEIVKYIDQPSALRMETRVYILRNAKASDVVQQLQGIIQEAQQIGARAAGPTPGLPPRPVVPRPPQPGVPQPPAAAGQPAEESVIEGKVILTSDERTNKIFILSRPANFKFFEQIIAELDAKVDPDVIIRVFNLNYAPAEDVASLINALVTGGQFTPTRRPTTGQPGQAGRTGYTQPPPPTPVGAGGAGLPGAEGTGFLQFAEGVRILPDPRTNSLLVMATKTDMLRIDALIQSVDTPVAQVLVEVVIAEVTLDNDLDVGVSAFKRLFQEGQLLQGGGYINRAPPPMNLIDGVTGSNALTGASLASGATTWFMSFQNLRLDVLIRAMSTSTKFKVLSTPIIQTMHNQEASIIVGSSRPVPVSTVSSVVGGTGTLSTGQLNSNIEYKDIAIELKVTPRVNPNGFVTMDIEQKINDFAGNISIGGTEAPVILKREAKSSVIVQDQSTIVLGGLIREDKTITESKVPFLGDIPFFGTAFKGKNTQKTRNELILFIRPTVMRNQAAAMAEAIRRAKMLRAGPDLELEEKFLSGNPSALDTAPTNNAPHLTIEPAPPDQSSMPAPDDADRYTAKVRALQEQTQTAP